MYNSLIVGVVFPLRKKRVERSDPSPLKPGGLDVPDSTDTGGGRGGPYIVTTVMVFPGAYDTSRHGVGDKSS